MNTDLDPDVCYRAIQTKDVRFDGRIFVGVRTTGIFCRPICPARTPNRENCSFFMNAAAAHEAGFCPCLRCRPELSPNLFSQVGTATTVSRALRLIAEGALNEGTVSDLATRLGVGDRHLRQLFVKHLGISPIVVAQTQRLLFAKQLLDETSLPITDVAMAAGFSSLRRFNTAIRTTYQRSPTELRGRSSKQNAATPDLTIKLAFNPPYHWLGFTRFLVPRVTSGLEAVGVDFYRRTIALDGVHGIVEVRPVKNQNYLVASICALDFADYEPRMMKLLSKRYPSITLFEKKDSHEFSDRLRAYLSGDYHSLDEIPVETGGTPFQQRVWFALRTIAPGTVISYGELAAKLGQVKAYRAVGMANSLNPVGIVLPCHRVVGANFSLTGYAGGLERRQWLLQHEGVNLVALSERSVSGTAYQMALF